MEIKSIGRRQANKMTHEKFFLSSLSAYFILMKLSINKKKQTRTAVKREKRRKEGSSLMLHNNAVFIKCHIICLMAFFCGKNKRQRIGKHFYCVPEKFSIVFKKKFFLFLSISVLCLAIQHIHKHSLQKNRQTFKRALQLNGDRVRKECH